MLSSVALPGGHDWSLLSAASIWRFVFVSHDDLPEPLRFVPSAFRLLALALFVPVASLAVIDILGYLAFALVLRPLGYASTRHFKDPEKDGRLLPIPMHGSIHSPSSTGEGVLPSSGESVSSGASDIFPSPAYSDTTPLPHIEQETPMSSRPGKPPALAAIASGASPFPASFSPSSSASSSTASSPPLRARATLASHESTRDRHKRVSSVSSVSGDESSTLRRMSRDRAPSVGLDGPLFGEADDTDTATTPGAESDAESGTGDYLSHRPVRGDGVPRGGFKLGLTEVQRRPSAA